LNTLSVTELGASFLDHLDNMLSQPWITDKDIFAFEDLTGDQGRLSFSRIQKYARLPFELISAIGETAALDGTIEPLAKWLRDLSDDVKNGILSPDTVQYAALPVIRRLHSKEYLFMDNTGIEELLLEALKRETARVAANEPDGFAPWQGVLSSWTDAARVSLAERDRTLAETAAAAGVQIAPPVQRYNVFVSGHFFRDRAEFEKDKIAYADRFTLRQVLTEHPRALACSILTTIRRDNIDPRTVIVQLPKSFKGDPCAKLLVLLDGHAPGIKFIVIDTDGLKEDENRDTYRKNLYAIMLIVRAVDKKDAVENSRAWRLLNFFITAFMGKTDAAALKDYLAALAANDMAGIIRTALSYKPMEKYDAPDYGKIAVILFSA
jgi:hypothetical protein